MKTKRLFFLAAFLLTCFFAHAAGGGGVLSGALGEWTDEIKAAYPYAAVIGLIVMVAFQTENLFGKQPDYKKGLVPILWYLGINGLLIAGVSYLEGNVF